MSVDSPEYWDARVCQLMATILWHIELGIDVDHPVYWAHVGLGNGTVIVEMFWGIERGY